MGINKTSAGFSYATGICTYRSTNNLLMVGVEGAAVEILHSYDTLSGLFKGANPITYIRRTGSSENYKTFDGKAITLTMKDLLTVAGVDLDAPYDQQPAGVEPLPQLQGVGFSEGKFPYPRLSGVRLLVGIKYYNQKLEITSSVSTGGTQGVYAIVEVVPQLTWTSRGQDISYRTSPTDWTSPFSATGVPQGAMEDLYAYGINVDVSATGLVGRFDFIFFMQTVIAGVVVMGTAKTLVDIIAMYGLGIKSKLYKRFIKEEVDLEKECARYAIQALVATHFFKAKDADGSGSLELSEVLDMLRETFLKAPGPDGAVTGEAGADGAGADGADDEITEDEISHLALYVMRSTDENRKEKRLAGKESATIKDIVNSSISLKEFINIFTKDGVDVPTLKAIVKATDLDEQVHADKEADPKANVMPVYNHQV